MNAHTLLSGGAERHVVLVVDDDALVRRAVSRALSRAGHEVHTAVDGVDALRTLGELGAVDLLLTDVDMPRLDGFGLVERARNTHPDLAVLVLTAEPTTSPRIPEAVTLLRKPMPLKAVEAAVADALCPVLVA